MPTTKKLLKEFGIDDNTNVTNMSEDDKDMISTVNELIKHELKTFMSKRGILKNNITKLWGVVWGQCTDALKEDIIGIEEYETKLDDYDTLWLLQQVKQCSAGADKTQHEYLTILKAMKALFLCRQGEHESLENIMERLESNLQTVKLAGGSITPPTLVTKQTSGGKTKEEATKLVEEQMMAMFLLEAANVRKYGELKKNFQNHMLQQENRYPATKSGAYTLLHKFVPIHTNNTRGPFLTITKTSASRSFNAMTL